jgi:hypothetical protein
MKKIKVFFTILSYDACSISNWTIRSLLVALFVSASDGRECKEYGTYFPTDDSIRMIPKELSILPPTLDIAYICG